VKTSVYIPDPLWEQARSLGISPSLVTQDALRAAVAEATARGERRKVSVTALVDVPNGEDTAAQAAAYALVAGYLSELAALRRRGSDRPYLGIEYPLVRFEVTCEPAPRPLPPGRTP